MRISFIPALIIAVLLAAAGMVTAQEHRGPKISVTAMRYDLGKVAQGAKASHIFEFRNTGTETLVIERVQSS